MEFGPRLRELRKAASLTQGHLAELAAMSKAGVTHLERGIRKPSWETIQKLAAALGVDVKAFLEPAADVPAPGRGRPRKKPETVPLKRRPKKTG